MLLAMSGRSLISSPLMLRWWISLAGCFPAILCTITHTLVQVLLFILDTNANFCQDWRLVDLIAHLAGFSPENTVVYQIGCSWAKVLFPFLIAILHSSFKPKVLRLFVRDLLLGMVLLVTSMSILAKSSAGVTLLARHSRSNSMETTTSLINVFVKSLIFHCKH